MAKINESLVYFEQVLMNGSMSHIDKHTHMIMICIYTHMSSHVIVYIILMYIAMCLLLSFTINHWALSIYLLLSIFGSPPYIFYYQSLGPLHISFTINLWVLSIFLLLSIFGSSLYIFYYQSLGPLYISFTKHYTIILC